MAATAFASLNDRSTSASQSASGTVFAASVRPRTGDTTESQAVIPPTSWRPNGEADRKHMDGGLVLVLLRRAAIHGMLGALLPAERYPSSPAWCRAGADVTGISVIGAARPLDLAVPRLTTAPGDEC